jgi:uncharacterized membrane protein YgcG
MAAQLLAEGRDPKAVTNRLVNAAVRGAPGLQSQTQYGAYFCRLWPVRPRFARVLPVQSRVRVNSPTHAEPAERRCKDNVTVMLLVVDGSEGDAGGGAGGGAGSGGGGGDGGSRAAEAPDQG